MSENGRSNSSGWPLSGGLPAACILLALVAVLFFPAPAWFGYSRHGASGLAAAAVAGGVCWLGATLALVITGLLRGPQTGVHAVLLGMRFRMGLPLGMGLLLHSQGGALARADVLGMLVAYYLVTLAAETLLAVRLVHPKEQVSEAP